MAPTDAPENLLAEWAGLLLRSLADAGVTDVVVSPGSRSTPFLLAAAACPGLSLHDAIDERAAAFFALGQARWTGRPSLLLCTSGSAAAHYLPAVIEAGAAYTPMLILSADRPYELQDCAAPQTIDQTRLFGDHARGFFDLGMPDGATLALLALRRRAAQAVFLATYPSPGAVHLNARARKPLEPRADASDAGQRLGQRAEEIARGPIARPLRPRLVPDAGDIAEVARICAGSSGLIVCGPAPASQGALRLREDILGLALATGYPLLCEAASQLRLMPPGARITRCDAFDLLLRSPAFRDRLRACGPGTILQLGAPPTSSGWETFLAERPGWSRVVVSPHGWNDPQSDATTLLFCEIGEAVRALLGALSGSPPPPSALSRLLGAADERVFGLIDEVLARDGGLSEAQAVHDVVAAVPRGSLLILGNSLPIREVDAFCRHGLAEATVLCQRGANGIDGLIAGAAGAASAAGRPTTLLIGDISFLHDLSGLGLCRGVQGPLLVVALQNHGGRIFEQLPLGQASGLDPTVLRHFTTPHDLTLEPAARLFGHRFARAETRQELRAALAAAHSAPGHTVTIIEAVVPPQSAREDQRYLVSCIDREAPRCIDREAPTRRGGIS